MQRNILMQTHRNKLDDVMKEVDAKLEEERNSASIIIDYPCGQLETIDVDESDCTINQLLSQASNDESIEISKIILNDGDSQPDFTIWESLGTIDNPESIDAIPFNTYFNVTPSSPINSHLSIIL